MAVTTLPPGYHAHPCAFSAETLRYVVEGAVSVFAENLEYRLSAGDFLNIPPMIAHWMWNRGDTPCQIVEAHTPAHSSAANYGLFGDNERSETDAFAHVFSLSSAYTHDELDTLKATDDAPWLARKEKVRSSPINQSGRMHSIARMKNSGKLDTLYVHGEASNMLIASRSSGYHSKPHVHKSEQLNYVLKGTVRIFVEDKCYALREGDFFRVPGWAEHWAFNDGDGSCVLAEVHAPVLAAPVPYPVPLIPTERLPFVKSTTSVYFEPRSAEEEDEMIRNSL